MMNLFWNGVVIVFYRIFINIQAVADLRIVNTFNCHCYACNCHTIYRMISGHDFLQMRMSDDQARSQDFERGGTTLDIIQTIATKRPKFLRLVINCAH